LIVVAGAPVIILPQMHPRHYCLLHEVRFSAFLTVEGLHRLLEAIIRGSPESEISRRALDSHNRA